MNNSAQGGATKARTGAGGYSYRSDGSLDYESARVWTDFQGRTLEAQLQDFNDSEVQLRDRAGNIKTIKRESLSAADNQFLKDVKSMALPEWTLAEDAPRTYTVIDTVDGQFYTQVSVKNYGNMGVTLITRNGGEVHIAYPVLNKSHLRKIGYPLELLEPEPIAAK